MLQKARGGPILIRIWQIFGNGVHIPDMFMMAHLSPSFRLIMPDRSAGASFVLRHAIEYAKQTPPLHRGSRIGTFNKKKTKVRDARI